MLKKKKMSERESLILSALLHDIGKFAQRGDEKLREEYDKKVRDIYCPSTIGYSHLLYSAQFIKEFFKNKESLIENLVLSHHKPEEFTGDKRLSKIIQISDWLSSGEREKREDESKIDFKKEPIISIFSQLNIEGGKSEELFNKPVKIDGDLEVLRPVKKDLAISNEYNFPKLWKEFKNESGNISYSSSFEKIFTQIFSLLEKYTIFIPSASVKDRPEISLFHHLKSTCAIATCLYDLSKTEDMLNEIIDELKKYFDRKTINENSSLKEKDFILLKGDISGIQNFIYSVTTSKALKGLRGRSFYLQLISEIIAYRIIDEFNLTKANIIYLGGGNFLILLPKREDSIEKINRISKEIDEIVFRSHKGKLGVIISCSEFSYLDFIFNFEKTFVNLNERLILEKRRKFKNILSREIFEPYPFKIEKELKGCEICGEEIEQGDKCSLCESFEDLASKIKKSKIMLIKKDSKKTINKEVNSWNEIFEILGYKIEFFSDNPKNGDEVKISLNDANFLQKGCDAFRFEAIYSPEGTLEDLSQKAIGIKKWGALRMDVDNLGRIFSLGLKENFTISRYSMLSYAFLLFFSLGIRYIIEKDYKEKCCVVYSGGDDLFIIAPWSDLPDIAEKIYNKFREYTCKHPKITLSGGIFISPSTGFPVYRAAIECGQAEEKAKTGNKNKITFLDVDLEWEKDFEKIKEVKNKLCGLLSNNEGSKVSRSILTILYSGYKEKEDHEKGKIPFVRIWRLFYALKRFMERHKGLEDKIEQIRKEFITQNFDLENKLDVAVRWAELLTRKEKGG